MANDDEILRNQLNCAERELNALRVSQLDVFATAALTGLCAASPRESAHLLAERAFKIADAMAQEKRHRAGLPV